MSNTRLEDYCFLTAIIWIPMGVLGKSAVLFGLAMMAAGAGLLLNYIRRNRETTYNTIHFPNREEDDTIEIQPYRGDNPNKK